MVHIRSRDGTRETQRVFRPLPAIRPSAKDPATKGPSVTMDMTNGTMMRRKVLGGMAAVAGASAFGCFASADLPTNPDVVVIGAGAAGIGASQRLTALGLSHVVIEASGRIGGRAHTDMATFGVPFDLGCAWIHAADRNPFFKLARSVHYQLHRHDAALDRIYYGRDQTDQAGLDAESDAEDAIDKGLTRLADDSRDVPATEAVHGWTLPFEAAATYLGPMDMGVDFADLSTFDYAKTADLDPNYLVREGFGTLVVKTGASIPAKLSTPARVVRYGVGKGVRIETDSGTIDAFSAIITVSTGVLADSLLRFDPELPDWKEEAIRRVPMGLLAKIPLLIPGDKLGVKPFENILVEYPGLQDIYFLAWPFATDLMVGFIGGEFGWELSAAGEEAAVAFAKERLAQTFGTSAPQRVTKALLTGWASNPFTRGAYSAALPGHYAERAVLARPLADRIFFAGEAVAGRFIQTCNGAYLSGIKVAEDVGAVLAGRAPSR